MSGAEEIIDGIKEEEPHTIASGLTTLDNELEGELDTESGFALALAKQYLEEENYSGLKSYSEDIMKDRYNLSPWQKGMSAFGSGFLASGAYYLHQSTEISSIDSLLTGEVGLFLIGYYSGLFGAPKIYQSVKETNYEDDFLTDLTNKSNHEFTETSEEAQRHLLEEYNIDTYGEFSKSD